MKFFGARSILILYFYLLSLNAQAYSTLIKNVTVFDSKAAKLVTHQDVLIEGEFIQKIGNTGTFKFSKSTRIVNGKGHFLLPGFIDAHAHVAVIKWKKITDTNGKPSLIPDGNDPESSKDALKKYLSFGITTVRNPAAPTNFGIDLREKVNSGIWLGPEVFTAGNTVNFEKESISSREKGIRVSGVESWVHSERELKDEVLGQIKSGVNFIKLYGSLDPSMIKVATQAAHDKNVKVIAHLASSSWGEALENGVDFITHAFSWNKRELTMKQHDLYQERIKGQPSYMARRIEWLSLLDFDSDNFQKTLSHASSKTVIDPTLIAYHTKFQPELYRDAPDLKLVTAEVRKSWTDAGSPLPSTFREKAKQQWPRVLEAVKRYYLAGIPLAIGTDYPNPWIVPGAGFHTELELMVSAGIPAVEVLKMATYNGAKTVMKETKVGVVQEGTRADLVLLEKDPTQDVRNTRSILNVWSKGKEVKLNPK